MPKSSEHEIYPHMLFGYFNIYYYNKNKFHARIEGDIGLGPPPILARKKIQSYRFYKQNWVGYHENHKAYKPTITFGRNETVFQLMAVQR